MLQGLGDLGSLRYIRPVKQARPGIASANRPRVGPFATLIDEILDDDSALDGLAFAYSELEEPDRQALARAVLQDSGNPTKALLALLTVEESPRLQQRLVGLIRKHGEPEHSAFLTGTETNGCAWLVLSLAGMEAEALRLTWKENQLEDIEIKPRAPLEAELPRAPTTIGMAVERLSPLLWRHIRSGQELPDGVERFAGFFSLS